MTKKVKVYLLSTSQPLEFADVKNTYQKGDMFCVYHGDQVDKFPIQHIFRIIEEY